MSRLTEADALAMTCPYLQKNCEASACMSWRFGIADYQYQTVQKKDEIPAGWEIVSRNKDGFRIRLVIPEATGFCELIEKG